MRAFDPRVASGHTEICVAEFMLVLALPEMIRLSQYHSTEACICNMRAHCDGGAVGEATDACWCRAPERAIGRRHMRNCSHSQHKKDTRFNYRMVN